MIAIELESPSKSIFSSTPSEKWCSPEEVHWYKAAEEFAALYLGKGNGGKCLVIGSPESEVRALERAGWNVTYLDVRIPPFQANHVQGSVTNIPFEPESFDAISSTCVLCHVGLGRYDDPVIDNGDLVALLEITRVMKYGAKTAIMFGPCIPVLGETFTWGSIHRVYSLSGCAKLAADAALTVTNAGLWYEDHWMIPNQERYELTPIDERAFDCTYCYYSMGMVKCL